MAEDRKRVQHIRMSKGTEGKLKSTRSTKKLRNAAVECGGSRPDDSPFITFEQFRESAEGVARMLREMDDVQQKHSESARS
jgi:hypothetical protein